MPQAVQCTESETCQKSIKCAVQGLWNSVIFSKSCLKVTCRSVLGWPCLKVPWGSQLLPLSSSLVWGGISGRKLTFFSGTKSKVSPLSLLHLPSSTKWGMRDDKLVSYSKTHLCTSRENCTLNKNYVSQGSSSKQNILTPCNNPNPSVQSGLCNVWSDAGTVHTDCCTWLNKCIPDLLKAVTIIAPGWKQNLP